jgi:hypothetical protein
MLAAGKSSRQALIQNRLSWRISLKTWAVLKKVLSAVRDHLNDPETIEKERKREEARQNLIKALKTSLE